MNCSLSNPSSYSLIISSASLGDETAHVRYWKKILARVTEEKVNEALCLINHRPRKCLGWKTAFELFMRKCHICIDNSSCENLSFYIRCKIKIPLILLNTLVIRI